MANGTFSILDVVLGPDLDPLVVVVHRDREDLLGLLLPDDVVVQELVDLTGLGELLELQLGGLGQLLLDDLVAQVDALVTDVDTGPGDELLDLLLRLPAEGAFQKVRISELGHGSLARLPSSRTSYPTPVRCPQRASRRAFSTR